MGSTDRGELERAVELFHRASSILFITGAGISAESGLPTYRGVGGLYDDRETEDGVRIEDALSSHMFRARPEITWKYLMQVGRAVAAHTFNEAHRVIAELEKMKERVWVLTQNIDGYHGRAGSANVIEIHGTMWRLRCESCGQLVKLESVGQFSEIPKCMACQTALRPDVVLFNETLPAAALEEMDRQISKGFDLVVSVGTSSQFAYIVEPVLLAVQIGVPTIEINPAATELSAVVDVHLELGAKPALLAIRQALQG